MLHIASRRSDAHCMAACERRMAADPDYAEKVNRLIELATTKDKPYIPLAA